MGRRRLTAAEFRARQVAREEAKAALKAGRTKYDLLRKNSIGKDIVNLVESGAELTIEEMAKRLKRSDESIAAALIGLRKKGFLYHPVGGSTEKGRGGHTHKGKGVLMDVTKKEADFLETQQRYDKSIDSKVNNSFRLLESAWLEFPELRERIETSVNQLTMKMISNKEELKQLKKG